MNRRQFLKACGLTAFGLAISGIGEARAANPAAAKRLPKPAAKARPPGTCGGYTDADANGVCDRSVKGPKPCTAVRCPANTGNKAFAEAAAKGAPAGSCALWKDPQQKGFCAVCLDPKPCLYVLCPSHKDHAADSKKGTPA
jgi:hypothetical protein